MFYNSGINPLSKLSMNNEEDDYFSKYGKYISHFKNKSQTLNQRVASAENELGAYGINAPPVRERPMYDRLLDLLSITSYPIMGTLKNLTDNDPNTTGWQGFTGGVKASNPFGQGYEEGEASFSDVMNNTGWKKDDDASWYSPNNLAHTVTGFAGDVLLDPTTYMTFGAGGVLKGAGASAARTSSKQMAKQGFQEAMEKLLKGEGANIAKRIGIDPSKIDDAVESITSQINNYADYNPKRTGFGLDLHVPIPYGRKLFGSKQIELIGADKLMNNPLTKMISPYVNALGEKLYDSKAMKTLGETFNKSGRLATKVARENPIEFFTEKARQLKSGADKLDFDKAQLKFADEVKELFSNIDNDKQQQLTDLFEDPNMWKVENVDTGLKETLYSKSPIAQKHYNDIVQGKQTVEEQIKLLEQYDSSSDQLLRLERLNNGLDKMLRSKTLSYDNLLKKSEFADELFTKVIDESGKPVKQLVLDLGTLDNYRNMEVADIITDLNTKHNGKFSDVEGVAYSLRNMFDTIRNKYGDEQYKYFAGSEMMPEVTAIETGRPMIRTTEDVDMYLNRYKESDKKWYEDKNRTIDDIKTALKSDDPFDAKTKANISYAVDRILTEPMSKFTKFFKDDMVELVSKFDHLDDYEQIPEFQEKLIKLYEQHYGLKDYNVDLKSALEKQIPESSIPKFFKTPTFSSSKVKDIYKRALYYIDTNNFNDLKTAKGKTSGMLREAIRKAAYDVIARKIAGNKQIDQVLASKISSEVDKLLPKQVIDERVNWFWNNIYGQHVAETKKMREDFIKNYNDGKFVRKDALREVDGEKLEYGDKTWKPQYTVTRDGKEVKFEGSGRDLDVAVREVNNTLQVPKEDGKMRMMTKAEQSKWFSALPDDIRQYASRRADESGYIAPDSFSNPVKRGYYMMRNYLAKQLVDLKAKDPEKFTEFMKKEDKLLYNDLGVDDESGKFWEDMLSLDALDKDNVDTIKFRRNTLRDEETLDYLDEGRNTANEINQERAFDNDEWGKHLAKQQALEYRQLSRLELSSDELGAIDEKEFAKQFDSYNTLFKKQIDDGIMPKKTTIENLLNVESRLADADIDKQVTKDTSLQLISDIKNDINNMRTKYVKGSQNRQSIVKYMINKYPEQSDLIEILSKNEWKHSDEILNRMEKYYDTYSSTLLNNNKFKYLLDNKSLQKSNDAANRGRRYLTNPAEYDVDSDEMRWNGHSYINPRGTLSPDQTEVLLSKSNAGNKMSDFAKKYQSAERDYNTILHGSDNPYYREQLHDIYIDRKLNEFGDMSDAEERVIISELSNIYNTMPDDERLMELKKLGDNIRDNILTTDNQQRYISELKTMQENQPIRQNIKGKVSQHFKFSNKDVDIYAKATDSRKIRIDDMFSTVDNMFSSIKKTLGNKPETDFIMKKLTNHAKTLVFRLADIKGKFEAVTGSKQILLGDIQDIKSVIPHEIAHTIGDKLYLTLFDGFEDGRYTSGWAEAITADGRLPIFENVKDLKLSNKMQHEDWAMSFDMLVNSPEEFMQRYPQRTKVMLDAFDQLSNVEKRAIKTKTKPMEYMATSSKNELGGRIADTKQYVDDLSTKIVDAAKERNIDFNVNTMDSKYTGFDLEAYDTVNQKQKSPLDPFTNKPLTNKQYFNRELHRYQNFAEQLVDNDDNFKSYFEDLQKTGVVPKDAKLNDVTEVPIYKQKVLVSALNTLQGEIRDVAEQAKTMLLDMGIKENVLPEKELYDSILSYAPHMQTKYLTDNEKKALEKVGIKIDNFAMRGENQHAKARKWKDANGKDMTSKEINKVMKENYGIDNYMETNIGRLMLNRGLTHQRLMYSKQFINDLVGSVGNYITEVHPTKKMFASTQDIAQILGKANMDSETLEQFMKANNIPDELRTTFKPVMEVNADLFHKLKQMDGTFRGFTVPEITEFDLLKTSNIIDNKNKSLLMDLFNRFTNMWKLQATAVNPGFHVGNYVGGVFNNYLNVGSKAVDPRVQHNAYKMLSNDVEYLQNTLVHTENGKQYTLAQIKDWMNNLGVASESATLSHTVFGDPADTTKQLLMQSDTKNRWNPLSPLFDIRDPLKSLTTHSSKQSYNNFVPYDVARNIGGKVESQLRATNFLANIMNGKTWHEAADNTNKFLFDYSDLSEFEKGIKQIVPFYTFMKKNMALQLEQALTNPKPYKQYGQFKRAVESTVSEEDQLEDIERNKFLDDKIQLPFTTKDEQGNRQPVFINPRLPLADINKLSPDSGDMLRTLISSIHPLPKVATELAANKNMYFDQPISYGEGDMRNAPGLMQLLTGGTKENPTKVPAESAYLLNQISPLLTNVSSVVDVKNNNEERAMRLAKMLGGVNLSTYDSSKSKEWALKDRLAMLRRMIKNNTGK